jgi:hypothetical protein
VDVLRATERSFFLRSMRKDDIETGIESYALEAPVGQSEQPGS